MDDIKWSDSRRVKRSNKISLHNLLTWLVDMELLVSGSLSYIGDWDLVSTVTGDCGGVATAAAGRALGACDIADAQLHLRPLDVTPLLPGDCR